MAETKTLSKYLAKVADNENLSYDESCDTMDVIMSGEASEIQVASFSQHFA